MSDIFESQLVRRKTADRGILDFFDMLLYSQRATAEETRLYFRTGGGKIINGIF